MADTSMTTAIALALLAALIFQIWVTVRVWRSDAYLHTEKSNQSKLVWLVPVLGAVIVLSVLTEEERRETTSKSETQQRSS